MGLIQYSYILWQQATSTTPPEASTTARPLLDRQLQYRQYTFPYSKVHLLVIPAQSRFRVVPALSSELDMLEHLAQAQGAIAAINGGYFDPNNQKTTAAVVLQGQLVGDPLQNAQLIGNPNLTPYLRQILNRSEFRYYQCGATGRYGIDQRQAAIPVGCQLLEALGGGPQLLPMMTATAEGFWDERTGRDPIEITHPNARTAVGLRSNGDVLWVMAAQVSGSTASGLTLEQLTAFLRSQGAISALNLDGGSSASFYYQGKTTYGKLDQQGQPVERPVKSVLLLLPNP